MISMFFIASSIRPSTSRLLSAFITFSRFGLIAGNLGRKTVQQSSYGNMEVSYVSIFFYFSIISILSKAINGRNTGIDTTEFDDVMLSIV